MTMIRMMMMTMMRMMMMMTMMRVMVMMMLYLSDLFDGLEGIKERGKKVWKDRQQVDDVHEAFYELPSEVSIVIGFLLLVIG